MMRRVQSSSPENPDAFPLYIEKADLLQPPRFALFGEEGQARQCKLPHSLCEFSRRLFLRQDLRCRWFGRSEELAEKASLGKELVLEDVMHSAGTRMRSEQ